MIEIITNIIKLSANVFNMFFEFKIRLSDNLVVSIGSLMISFGFIMLLIGVACSFFGRKE